MHLRIKSENKKRVQFMNQKLFLIARVMSTILFSFCLFKWIFQNLDTDYYLGIEDNRESGT